MCPHIPVGGRLQYFNHQWEKITDDKWVLQTLKEGLKLEFLNSPIQTGARKTIVNFLILEEVLKLLEKCAIELVSYMGIQKGFYSTFFLVTKKSGNLRSIINLRPLNRYMMKQHFNIDKSSLLSEQERLGNISRSQRCLFTYSNASKSS